MKETENIDKYLDLDREIRKLRNMKVIIVPLVLGILGTFPKSLRKRLKKWNLGEE